MALKKGRDLPENAIELTVQEAIHYQWHQVRNWPKRWDVWPTIYGVPAIAFFAGLNSLRINAHYRRKLKLRHFGSASTKLAMGLTPVIFTVVPHYVFVTQELFLDRQCSICLQIRAIAVQIFSSTIYPVVMSPIANFMFATRHGTYALPYWADFKGTMKLWFSMNRTLAPKMTIFFPLQILAAGFVTYMESKQMHTIRSKIESGEEEMVPQIKIEQLIVR